MDCQVKCDEFEVFEIIVHLLFEEFLHLGLRYQPSDFLISIGEKEYAKLEVEVFFQISFFFLIIGLHAVTWSQLYVIVLCETHILVFMSPM